MKSIHETASGISYDGKFFSGYCNDTIAMLRRILSKPKDFVLWDNNRKIIEVIAPDLEDLKVYCDKITEIASSLISKTAGKTLDIRAMLEATVEPRFFVMKDGELQTATLEEYLSTTHDDIILDEIRTMKQDAKQSWKRMQLQDQHMQLLNERAEDEDEE